MVFLTNENITFAGNASGVVTAVTKTCSVVAYTGTTKVTPTLGTISGAPTGMTVTAGSASGNEIPLTIAIAANSNLGGSGQLEGTISIPVTAPVSTTLQLRWSKVNTGATGSEAYVLTVYAPGGTVFTNGTANGSASMTLNAQFFQGSTDRTTSSSALFLWQKYASGSWTTFKAEASGNSGNTCTVNASDVIGTATFRCRARYGSSSSTYFYDTIPSSTRRTAIRRTSTAPPGMFSRTRSAPPASSAACGRTARRSIRSRAPPTPSLRHPALRQVISTTRSPRPRRPPS